MFANAHFRGKGDPAFTVEQFLGERPRMRTPHPWVTRTAIDLMTGGGADKVPEWAKTPSKRVN